MNDRRPTRRDLLRGAWNGFALLPFAELAGPGGPHHAPRARAVIFLYMDGGPSSLDLFDYKPELQKIDGQPFPWPKAPTQFQDDGHALGPRWPFRRHGDSGQWLSDRLPHLARQADRLCVVRSVVAEHNEHTNANYFLHTGHGLQGRPSAGAWLGYGLGRHDRDLPAYVVCNGGLIPPGGSDNFGAGFLPPHCQASVLAMRGDPLPNLVPRQPPAVQRRRRELARALDAEGLAHDGSTAAIDAAIRNHELAFRMQSAVPELLALAGESPALRAAYGCDDDYEPTRTFAQQCLLARRLVERGVRFVQLTCPDTGHDRWDQHSQLVNGHTDNCRMVDRPIAALLADLQARGLLDETIVWFGGEFGRTPFVQGGDGRDHNPFGFTMWFAGGGFRPGTSFGATDELGYKAVQDPVTIHDVHATLLHLLGFDHERLTWRFGGRDLRLTDVYGKVVRPLLA